VQNWMIFKPGLPNYIKPKWNHTSSFDKFDGKQVLLRWTTDRGIKNLLTHKDW
jgi:hypothetical protein